MFTMEPKETNEAIGQLKKVVVRLTLNGVTQDYRFNVSPTADTAVVEINLDKWTINDYYGEPKK